ncbi:hypothetical protein JTB14_006369 [Gonioctena quinquepunctata]|nr:hypothetical protein JTB14_006369 [Gonioctena quinquepunctata]
MEKEKIQSENPEELLLVSTRDYRMILRGGEDLVLEVTETSAEKRLFIQTEKDRQELERMKDLEKKQKEKEIENRMKILQLEHELKEAEFAAAADEENDDTNRSVSSKRVETVEGKSKFPNKKTCEPTLYSL